MHSFLHINWTIWAKFSFYDMLTKLPEYVAIDRMSSICMHGYMWSKMEHYGVKWGVAQLLIYLFNYIMVVIRHKLIAIYSAILSLEIAFKALQGCFKTLKGRGDMSSQDAFFANFC